MRMRKFFLYVTTTLLFFSAMAMVGEITLPNCVQNEYTVKYKYLTTKPQGIKTLLLGNSYAENSINPYTLGDSVYDAAIAARWIYWDKEIVRCFAPRMTNLKVVIYPLGYRMAFINSAHYHNPYSPTRIVYRYVKYMHLEFDKPIENIYRHSALIHGKLHWKEYEYDVLSDSIGYVPLIGVCTEWTGQNTPADVHCKYDAEAIAQEHTLYLTEMAKMCEEMGVRLIVVTPPCHNSFVANTCPEGIERVHRIIEDVREAYPIEYKDYLQDPAYRADSLYYNCSHLNDTGATLFGEQIRKDFDL